MLTHSPKVDLLLLGDVTEVPDWPLGRCIGLPNTTDRLGPTMDGWLSATDADFCLLWDPQLGRPDAETIAQAANLPGDVWHAGLRLGTGGLPRLMDCVEPVWLMNRDPDPSIVATSWRVSLRACLVRVEVLRQLGTVDTAFESLTAAGLDLGCRFLRRGAIVRHVPGLVPTGSRAPEPVPLHDELRFVRQHYGSQWFAWTILRALFLGYPPVTLLKAAAKIQRPPVQAMPAPFRRREPDHGSFDAAQWHDTVSVLIPTLERYPYLRNELAQLRLQTIRPKEVIVVDQTPEQDRDRTLASEFADLPIRLFYQDTQGQCTAWNHALKSATGKHVLFLGDDADRIAPDFIERFLRTQDAFDADMVASAVEEIGTPVPDSASFLRVSDIFPIAMARLAFFEKTGLYDYAFDRGARADADVALRWHMAGALMVLDPDIRVLHLKAPRGGLRAHGARVITTGSSRRRLTHRDLSSPTEMYLVGRHFTERQVREMIWQKLAATFVARGSRLRRVLKIVVSCVYLPNSIWKIRKNVARAQIMREQFPQIPSL